MGAREDLAAVMIFFLVLDGIVLGLRIFVRTYVNRSLGYDDYTMAIAYVSFSQEMSTTRETLKSNITCASLAISFSAPWDSLRYHTGLLPRQWSHSIIQYNP